MPEGDTVAKVADELHRALAGRSILRSEFRVPAHAAADLSGQAITGVATRGKHLLIRTSAGLTLHTHLKMDGSWTLLPAGRRPRDTRDVIRVLLETDTCTAVGSELGVVEIIRTSEEDRVLGHLGPDLLADTWDSEEAMRRLRADPDRSIAEALLDQTVMAGLGNIYKSELCFLRGLVPSTPVGDVADLEALVELARRLLVSNRATGNQVTTGDPRRGRRHWVYGRSGEPCRRCGTTIRRSADRGAGSVGERTTFWCPGCQPDRTGVNRAGDRSPRPRSGRDSRPRERNRLPRR